MAVSEHVYTYSDLMDYLTAITDGGARTKDLRMHKETILGAYRDLSMCYEWKYYIKEARVDLVANYNTGTIQYFDAPREVELTGGSWPTWSKYGRIRINDVVYDIEGDGSESDRKVLTTDSNPGEAISSGTSYDLFRSVYPLPDDLWRIYDVGVEKNHWITYYISPTEWRQREAFHQSSGQTWAWTIMKDPDNDGRWSLCVDPSPSTAEPLMFVYRRKPRVLRWAGTETAARTGTTSGSVSAGGTSITIASATMSDSMVGSIIRIGDTSTVPTGLAGSSPYVEQAKIKSIAGNTLTLAEGVTYAISSGTKVMITDPVDMSDTMLEALKAQIEYRFARFANDQRGVATARQVADFELRRALEADQLHHAGIGQSSHSRYHYMFSNLGGQITTDS